MPQILQSFDSLGPDDKKGFEKLMAYAKANPVSMDMIKAMIAGDRPPVGDYLEFQWVWPKGFRCVFSYEQQPFGLCRHLSVSVFGHSNPEPQIPSPGAMNTIADAFGFRPGKLDSMWVDPDTKSINMVQKVED